MKISDVLRSRGQIAVVTVAPSDPITDLLQALAEHGIGAAVVSPDGEAVVGIVSERDVARALNRSGADLLSHPVSSIMTSQVFTITPDTEVESIAQMMTEHRIRHLPVLIDGRLDALVSIGDVVKFRIAQLQGERDHLVDYIQQ